jgi:histidine phosphotransferase ChpT
MGEIEAAEDSLLLAETLATRLCHDLSGHVNAVAGAVEMLRDDPASGEDAIVLAHDASTVLVRRLRLLRAAWGGGGADMAVPDFLQLTNGAFGPMVRLDLDGLGQDGRFSALAGRLALNVVLLAVECLPRGGLVELSGEPERDLLVRISGPRAAWPTGLAAMMADPAQARGSLRGKSQSGAARTLQAPLTALLAHVARLRMGLLMGGEAVPAPPLLVSMRPSG